MDQPWVPRRPARRSVRRAPACSRQATLRLLLTHMCRRGLRCEVLAVPANLARRADKALRVLKLEPLKGPDGRPHVGAGGSEAANFRSRVSRVDSALPYYLKRGIDWAVATKELAARPLNFELRVLDHQ